MGLGSGRTLSTDPHPTHRLGKGVQSHPKGQDSTRSQSRYGLSQVTVIFKDVTTQELALDVVRRSYAWSFNDKVGDAQLKQLLHDQLAYNRAGTQAPQRRSRALQVWSSPVGAC